MVHPIPPFGVTRPEVRLAAEASPFQQAFERLLIRAPGPVFPRARALYLQKYSLEHDHEAS
ncbi:MAG: hypothetical protein ACKOZT_02780, partial [Cyanobium sp.]